ncbi:MAG: hypothetical protein KIS81_08450 [Maricaulaceae bacterium]|nr:hypothetical protein [Maricaulaceae bacterium]
MSSFFKLAGAAIVAAAVFTGGASAQIRVVLGDTGSAACYRGAASGMASTAALRDCDSALAEDAMSRETRAKTLINRAVIYLQMERAEEALRDLDAAVAMNFQAPEIHLNYSGAYIRLNRLDEAIEQATLAIESGFSQIHRAYFNRAIAYEEIGDIHAAYADYSRAAELAPEWSPPRRQLERFTVVSRQSGDGSS